MVGGASKSSCCICGEAVNRLLTKKLTGMRIFAAMAEQFIVSARKYRPDSWETVVGQKHITTTLQNAIANEQIAQSYLFTGPRGVGKTTCARIFAKAVNGFLGLEMDDMQFNVFELDAASNNSVDDIRSIVESVRIPPQNARYKVYIIDEVHMLSPSAFNAFLKTLEEPPAHALFILATTEKHKIIPTILSRCQIFDFNRIKIKDMTEHLASIAAKEGITAEPEALHVIAQKADGAMRDALSIFDQVVAFCGRHLTYQAVIQNLNVLDYEYYFRLTDCLLQEDIPGSLKLFDEVLNNGFDGHHFIVGLGAHFRNLLVSKDPQTVQLMELSESAGQRYMEQAAKCELHFMVKSLQFINDCDLNYRASKHQRLLVELTLMQVCSIPFNIREGEKKKFSLKPFRSGGGVPPAVPVRVTTPSRPVAGDGQLHPRPNPVAAKVLQENLPDARPLLGKTQLIRKAVGEVSITGMKIGQQSAAAVNHEVPVEKEAPGREFSLAEIQEAWRTFTAEKLSHNKQVQSAFTVATLSLASSHMLRVAFPSQTQFMYFNDTRAALGEFLRDRNNIRGVDFELTLQAAGDTKRLVILSDKEKFDAMKIKNPSLEYLWRTFQLRVEG
jgi:DNA polymerase III subunit gamma/tau